MKSVEAINATNLIKTWLKQQKIPARIRTTPTKHEWISVSIPADDRADCMSPLHYSHTFLLEDRILASKVSYPSNPDLWTGSVGNINGHDIAMLPSQWLQFFATKAKEATDAHAVASRSA